MVVLESLKKEFLNLLDRDLEFRYAVAGYLGLSEILKKLDLLAEEQVKLREEQTKILTEITRIWTEITKIWTEIARLREDFNRAFKQLDSRLSRVERTLEKITLEIEDEARIMIKYRLKNIGCEIDVFPIILPDLEINIYGASDELCIIGEASVRASSSIIDEINRNIDKMRNLYPNMLRPKIIKVVYTSLAMPDLIERAEKEGIWVLKATGDIVKPKDLPLN
ncbi:MAG: hypothetical protein QXO74_03755 [Candidatus Methanomethylicia archaeon]